MDHGGLLRGAECKAGPFLLWLSVFLIYMIAHFAHQVFLTDYSSRVQKKKKCTVAVTQLSSKNRKKEA